MNINEFPQTNKFPPVYKYSFQESVKRGESEQFRDSHKHNIECSKAIDAALTKYYDDNTYELDTAAASKEIVGKFGFDRTMGVLGCVHIRASTTRAK